MEEKIMYWFWTILVGAILVWYVLVTVLVAYGGGKDILRMLGKLNKKINDEPKI